MLMEQTILVGTTDGLHQLDESRNIHFAGHEVRSLEKSESGWWAIIDRQEIWWTNTASKWIQIGSVDESLRANCLLPTTSGLLIGTSEARLFTLQDISIEQVLSFDKAPGRENWYTPWGAPADVRSISTNSSGTVYVNVHVGGIIRSADGGKSWKPTIDMHADVHQVLFDIDSGLLLTASALGLAISNDDGESWQFYTEGLHGTYLRAVAVANRMILVTASTGPRTSQAAVYRKPLSDINHFERCQQGLPEWFPDNINTFCLVASGSRVVFGTAEGSVYLSSDEGQSWNLVANDLPPVRCVAFG